MLIINTEHYVRGLAAQGSTKIENGVREQIVLLILQETTDRESGFFVLFCFVFLGRKESEKCPHQTGQCYSRSGSFV